MYRPLLQQTFRPWLRLIPRERQFNKQRSLGFEHLEEFSRHRIRSCCNTIRLQRANLCRLTYNLRHGKSSFRIEEQCCAMYFSSYLKEQGCGPGRYFFRQFEKKNHLASNISPTLHGPALFLRGGSYTRTGFSRPQSARALVQTSRRRTVFYDGECRHKAQPLRNGAYDVPRDPEAYDRGRHFTVCHNVSRADCGRENPVRV